MTTLFCAAGTGEADTVAKFAARYKKTRGEFQKRDLCIELIDRGVLYLESPVEDLKRVFLQDFHDYGIIDEASNHLAIVYFVRVPDTTNGESVALTGWFLSVRYRPDGSITHYCLSNESKTTGMEWMYKKQKLRGQQDEDPGLPPVNGPKGPRF